MINMSDTQILVTVDGKFVPVSTAMYTVTYQTDDYKDLIGQSYKVAGKQTHEFTFNVPPHESTQWYDWMQAGTAIKVTVPGPDGFVHHTCQIDSVTVGQYEATITAVSVEQEKTALPTGYDYKGVPCTKEQLLRLGQMESSIKALIVSGYKHYTVSASTEEFLGPDLLKKLEASFPIQLIWSGSIATPHIPKDFTPLSPIPPMPLIKMKGLDPHCPKCGTKMSEVPEDMLSVEDLEPEKQWWVCSAHHVDSFWSTEYINSLPLDEKIKFKDPAKIAAGIGNMLDWANGKLVDWRLTPLSFQASPTDMGMQHKPTALKDIKTMLTGLNPVSRWRLDIGVGVKEHVFFGYPGNAIAFAERVLGG